MSRGDEIEISQHPKLSVMVKYPNVLIFWSVKFTGDSLDGNASVFHGFISDAMKLKWKEVLWCLTLLEFHIFQLCDSTKITSSKPGGEVNEKSLKVSKEVVEEAGVNHTGVFLLRFVVEQTRKVYPPNDQEQG